MINIFGRAATGALGARREAAGSRLRGTAVRQRRSRVRTQGADAGTHLARPVRRPERQGGRRDIDATIGPKRAEADRPALERVYRSGAVNQGTHLDKVAIIDLRGPDPGAFHDVYRTYAMRARLDARARHGRQPGAVARPGAAARRRRLHRRGDRRDGPWLAAIEADKRDIPLARKIIQDKPTDLGDRCTNGRGRGDAPGRHVRRDGAELLDAAHRGGHAARPTTRSSASSSRCAATRYGAIRSPTPSGRELQRRSRTASATTPSPAWIARPPCRG